MRGVRILRLFLSQEILGVTEIAGALGLPKSSVHRIVQALVETEMLEPVGGTRRRYKLGPAAWQFGQGVLRRSVQPLLAYPELWHLSRLTGEVVNLAAPVPEGMVYVEKIRSSEPLQVDLPAGTVVPYHCTAVGKAYLALSGRSPQDLGPLTAYTPNTLVDPTQLERDLDLTRSRGYAMDRQEYSLGVTGIGAAIVNGEGKPVGAIGLGIPASRLTPERETQLASLLLDTAQRISQSLLPKDPALSKKSRVKSR